MCATYDDMWRAQLATIIGSWRPPTTPPIVEIRARSMIGMRCSQAAENLLAPHLLWYHLLGRPKMRNHFLLHKLLIGGRTYGKMLFSVVPRHKLLGCCCFLLCSKYTSKYTDQSPRSTTVRTPTVTRYRPVPPLLLPLPTTTTACASWSYCALRGALLLVVVRISTRQADEMRGTFLMAGERSCCCSSLLVRTTDGSCSSMRQV